MCWECVLFIHLFIYLFLPELISLSLAAKWKGYTSNIWAFSNSRKATRDNLPATRDNLPATRDILPATRDNLHATRDPRQLDSPFPSCSGGKRAKQTFQYTDL